MKSNRALIGVLSLAVVMARPPVAAAQELVSRLPIAVGHKVTVTTEDGQKVRGEVRNLTPATLELVDGNAIRSLAVADVTRIQERDSVTNGVIKGAVFVGLTGLLVGGIADASNGAGQAMGNLLVALFGVEPEPIKHTNHALTGAVAGVVIGALLGNAIDSGKEKTLYEREAPIGVALRPILSSTGKGVGLAVRW